MTGDGTGEVGQAALDQIVRALAANVSVGRKMSALEDRRWQESVARIALEIAEVDVAKRLALSYGDGYRTGYRDGHRDTKEVS